jgi:hypothetical protein
MRAVSAKGIELLDAGKALFPEGGRRSLDELSVAELKRYRKIQDLGNKLSSAAGRSICSCITCGKGDRDMVYNKSYDAWYCTECYDMHRTAAIELFQTIGKTKPYGHEETVRHELLESFLDYEESHEIELKLVREGILIYLLRFRYTRDDTSYATLEEIQKVLDRNQKAIKHVLNSLEQEKLVELEDTYSNLKVWLTRHHGVIEAERVLRIVRSDSFNLSFPTTLEDFDLLIGLRSDMMEYEDPYLYEQIVNDLKSKKVPQEEIKRKIEELKKHTGDMMEYDDPHLYEQSVNDLKSKKVPQEEIKRKIEELKKHTGDMMEYDDPHLYEQSAYAPRTEKFHLEKQKRRIEELKKRKMVELKKDSGC